MSWECDRLFTAVGENPKTLTSSVGMNTFPAWSPDGRRLAFTSNRDGDCEIYVVDFTESAAAPVAQRLTNRPGKDDYAHWHPDGKRLLLISEQHGEYDVYLIPAK